MPWEVDDDAMLWHFAGVLFREQNIQFLMQVSFETVLENCTEKSVFRIEPPFPPYKARQEPLDESVLKILLNQVVGYHNVTFNEQDMNDTYEDILTLASDLRAMYDKVDYKHIYGVPINELIEKVPNVDWDRYFETLMPEEMRKPWLDRKNQTEVIVYHSNYFNGIKDVVKKHKRETVYNYGYAMVVQHYYNMFKTNTDPSVTEIDIGFAYGNILQNENPCLYLAFQYFPSASARFLFDIYNTDSNEWRYGVNLIAETIFPAFRYLVFSLDWMDSSDKVLINEKVNRIWFKHIVPNWLSKVDSVNAKTSKVDYNLSLIASNILRKREMFKTSLKPLLVGSMEEEAPEFTTNAYYMHRTISILLGMMLPPTYHNFYPLSLKYGGLGITIGHELLHGFDTTMIRFESYPDAPRWLKPETLKQYDLKTQCFIQQYSKYCLKGAKVCVQGEISLDENIGDVEGVKVVYAAYKFQTQINDEVDPPLPGVLQNYTHDQLFFISSARQWCNSLTAENFKKAAFDRHAPDQTRADLPVTNIRSFAKAFKCRVGSRHAPIKTCSLWGNFWDV